MRRLIGAGLCLLTPLACLDEEFPPTPGPSVCNNDGICDVTAEDCTSCPTDCFCCAAVLSVGQDTVTSAEAVNGLPDGTVATLSGISGLTITFGREVVDFSGPDFELHGTVTSETTANAESCSLDSNGIGAFEVYLSEDGESPRFLGLWTKDHHEFDLGCAEIPAARVIQIQGQSGAQGQLDAVTAQSCCRSTGSCTVGGSTALFEDSL